MGQRRGSKAAAVINSNVTGNALKNMRVIKTTLITTIIVCLIIGIFVLLKEQSFGQFFYMIIMLSGSIIVPIFLGALIYELIKKWIKEDRRLLNFIFRVILFGATVQIAMVVWTILDVITYYGDFSGLTIDNIIKDYTKEFLPWMYIVILSSILIPTVDKELTRRTNRKK